MPLSYAHLNLCSHADTSDMRVRSGNPHRLQGQDHQALGGGRRWGVHRGINVCESPGLVGRSWEPAAAHDKLFCLKCAVAFLAARATSPDSSRMQVGHTDFVSALAFAPASSIHPDGLVVSGARDATVRLWNPVRFTELQILEGHKYQVGGGKMGVQAGQLGTPALASQLAHSSHYSCYFADLRPHLLLPQPLLLPRL